MPRTARKAETDRLYRQRARQKNRLAVITALGGKCGCCGESEFTFLAVDHKNGGGAEHRREFKNKIHAYWLDVMARLDEFQVLCHNCNYAKHFNEGGCPHQKKAE